MSKTAADLLRNMARIPVPCSALVRWIESFPGGLRAYTTPCVEQIPRILTLEEDAPICLIAPQSMTTRAYGEETARAIHPTHVVDMSGVYLPGYGMPMVLLLSLPSARSDRTVLCVGLRGEPATPKSVEEGFAWRSFVEHWNEVGYEDQWFRVTECASVNWLDEFRAQREALRSKAEVADIAKMRGQTIEEVQTTTTKSPRLHAIKGGKP